MENVNVFPMIYKHRVNGAGEVSVVICVTLNNKPVHYDKINKKVKLTDWDEKLKRSQTNPILNALLQKRTAELQMVYTKSQVLDIRLTKSRIKKIAKGEDLGKDFIAYCEKRIPERYPKKEQGKPGALIARKLPSWKPSKRISVFQISILTF